MCDARPSPHHHWLSYGAGRNSTALLVLLCEGRLARYEPWTAIFADTGDEKDETYSYIERVVTPYLARFSRELITVRGRETVLGRWQRLSVTGSRILRTCTVEAKIRPIEAHIKANGGGVSLIGIDAGESHRARTRTDDKYPKRWPLIEEVINLAGCRRIIREARLCEPVKSGCWHCPFIRVREVLALAREQPERFATIEALEAAATEKHPLPVRGKLRTQWHDRPARWWRERAVREAVDTQGSLFGDIADPEMPCGCWDGHEEERES